jgi:hypothetical protein
MIIIIMRKLIPGPLVPMITFGGLLKTDRMYIPTGHCTVCTFPPVIAQYSAC